MGRTREVPNSARGDVKDDTSPAVVAAVGHALVNGAIRLNVDVVAHLVGAKVGRNVLGTVATEGASKFRASASAITVRVGHAFKENWSLTERTMTKDSDRALDDEEEDSRKSFFSPVDRGASSSLVSYTSLLAHLH